MLTAFNVVSPLCMGVLLAGWLADHPKAPAIIFGGDNFADAFLGLLFFALIVWLSYGLTRLTE